MSNGYDQLATKLPVHIWSPLWREALLADGRSDAFEFALKCEGNLGQITSHIQEIAEMMTDPDMLKGPMAPGNGPRIYREGYLAGLTEAIGMVTKAIVEEAFRQTEPSQISRT